MWRRILVVSTSSKSEDQRREVSHAVAATNGEDGGSKDVTQRNLEDYRAHGCRREGQRISKDFCGREGHHSCRRLDGAKGARGSCASHKGLARMLRQVWRSLFSLEELQKPRVPEGCFELGARVEVSWTMGQGSRATVRWLPAPALGLHDNTERNVHQGT